MATRKKMALTQSLNVAAGSHILYFYIEPEQYIQNAVSFIRHGITLEQNVVIIENHEIWSRMEVILREEVNVSLLDRYVRHIDNNDFYGLHDQFAVNQILQNLNSIVQPYLDTKADLRLWGNVRWNPQSDILSKLQSYEDQCDITISEMGFLTVCAYDGNTVPAMIQTKLMKNHEYLMTDETLVQSSLYKNHKHHAPYPALATRAEMESEMDLYKQKLDFVHVVSHEVRNPLTVIQAYAQILMTRNLGSEDQEKLQAICDYVRLIDNEITHIINTEHMLSTDLLWRRKLILPKLLIEEVIEFMSIKARTQNIQLRCDMSLSGKEMLLSNSVGFKLIISNLLSNAIKYSEEGMMVTLSVSMVDQHLMLNVIDEGVGMSEEQVSKLFRKYEKTNEEKSGQGIGLFMVKKLIDHFEGSIEVVSKIDQGTRIKVSLPLHSNDGHGGAIVYDDEGEGYSREEYAPSEYDHGRRSG